MGARKHNYWVRKVDRVNDCRTRGSKVRLIMTTKITKEELQQLYAENPSCAYCELQLAKEEITLDHATPLSRGGTHSIDNLVICCSNCNSLKGTKTAQEYLDFIPEFLHRFNRHDLIGRRW